MSAGSRALLATLVYLLIAAAARPAAAQSSPPGPAAARAGPGAAGVQVAAVRLEGVPAADSSRTAAALGVAPGEVVTAGSLREGLRRVWALGIYDDLWAGLHQEDAGTVLVVHTAERPRLARLEVTGNRKIDSDKLLPHTGLIPGARFSNDQMLAAVDSLKRIYREKGYVRAAITASTQNTPGGAALTFQVEEGAPARIGGAEFPGAAHFPAKTLKKQLASKPKGLLKSGKLDPDKLAKDVENLTRFYQDHGYREVKVTRDSLAFSPDGRRMTLVYDIDEGAPWHIGAVGWSGNQALTRDRLATLTKVAPGQLYNGSLIKKTVEDAYAQYAELGYLYLSIDPAEQPRDSDVVNLTFDVQEGAPSHLRRINIEGNTRTKEKVVRRELLIHEGDLFRRSALVRTQQDVFRLGYFQDVQVDFRPADTTDVDLVLHVQEKETGTASAGAGYSSDGGLTGFVQLGHNNLFGNGQSVSIQVERGARRSNVDLSFTDPYFRDTRTTLGASLFSLDRETQIVGSGTTELNYREVRRGGSVRLGRPLRKIDSYTRGYLTYSLEGVDLKMDATTTEDSAQLALRAIVAGGARTTSMLEATISRDNTINPFYPTGGMRTSLSSDFAGGPLGGQVKYNKDEIDGRFYRHLFGPFTGMVRLRGGLLTAYGKTPPAYETFRLGGTTFYGLRGYEDYEVVPKENIRTIYTTTTVIVDSIATTRRDSSIVAYPGGRVMEMLTLEAQFPIVNPVHGLFFFDAGSTWNSPREIQAIADLHKSVGAGLRVEVPLLGNIGLDLGYGFDRRKPGWRTHFLLGNMFF